MATVFHGFLRVDLATVFYGFLWVDLATVFYGFLRVDLATALHKKEGVHSHGHPPKPFNLMNSINVFDVSN